MGDALKWILGGLGLYWVYNSITGGSAAVAAGTATTGPAGLTITAVNPTSLTAGVASSLSLSVVGAIAPSFTFNGSAVSFSGSPSTSATTPVTFVLSIPASSAGIGTVVISDSGRQATATLSVVAPVAAGSSGGGTGGSGSSGSGSTSSGGGTGVSGTSPVLNSTFQSSDFGSSAWVSRVSALMQAAAGNNSQNYDNWSYFYQNQAGGSAISASLFTAIVNVNNMARSLLITSQTFLQALVTCVNQGLSGYARGLGAVRKIPLPVSAIRTPAGLVISNGRRRLLIHKGN